MKKSLFIGIAIIGLTVALSSCNEKDKLAKAVEGSWSGVPTVLANDAAGQSSTMDNITFTIADGQKNGGAVAIVSAVSLQHAADAATVISQPFSASVAATASIEGTWRATDDDEISISFDSKSLKIHIDPEMVGLVMNPLTGNSQSEIDSLKPKMVDYYQVEIGRQMQIHYSDFARMKDVKVKDGGSILKFELKKTDYIFSRQG